MHGSSGFQGLTTCYDFWHAQFSLTGAVEAGVAADPDGKFSMDVYRLDKGHSFP